MRFQYDCTFDKYRFPFEGNLFVLLFRFSLLQKKLKKARGTSAKEKEGSFLCDQIACINQSQRCDGVFHCQDKTDELNCVFLK
ncbi:hypothetical protein Anas_12466 [Armadillidium nasatum]|uniref:Uncharacterized protein n=1 Tax=Armadillidium nasatum TaxID=96803 RepID=A0A5N5T9E1_9CRUS|nr:hypothetical protein Anas_12466 [Armadillidium nasatum]